VDRQRERAGLGYAALCVISGAFVPAFAKLTTGRADALAVAALTSAFAGLAAALWLGASGSLGALVAPRQRGRLAFVGALGTAATGLLFFEGARRTSAIDVALCLQAESAYSLVLARLFLGHRLTLRRVASVGVLLLGIALAVGGAGVGASLGVALLLATPLCWQVSHLVVLRGLAGVPPRLLAGARYLYGGALLLALWLARGGPAEAAPAGGWGGLLAILAVQGVLLSFAGTLVWYETIARLDLARATAIVVPSIPLVSLAASFALVGEVASPRQAAGLALVAAGVLAFVTAPHPPHRAAPPGAAAATATAAPAAPPAATTGHAAPPAPRPRAGAAPDRR
jgi:O-acetylserine/cysteine efflux transporter